MKPPAYSLVVQEYPEKPRDPRTGYWCYLGAIFLLGLYSLGITVSLLFYSKFSSQRDEYFVRDYRNETNVSTPSVRKCPERWIYGEQFSKCYLPVLSRATQETARQRCKAMNAELLTINSMEEDYFVLNLPVGDEKLYTKCHDVILAPKLDNGNPRKLIGLNGEPALFSHFHKIEPNNEFGKEFCVEARMYRYQPPHHPKTNYTGTWNDFDCQIWRDAFVCEISIF